MKRAILSGILLIIFCVTTVNVYAIEDEQPSELIGVYLNAFEIEFSQSYGKPFIDEANRTQMPFRIVLETYGATVEWLEEEQIAVATKDGVEVRVPIGERYIIRNTEVIIIDTAAVIVDNRTYIPIRAVMEAFGCEVSWDGTTHRVQVTYEEDALIINRLPKIYDLREEGKLTPIRNQYDIGACWAFATLGALESFLLPEKVYDFSEDHLSLTHGYDLTQNEGGDFQISLAYLARWSGPVYEEEDPYGDGIGVENLKSAVHIQEAIILPNKDYSAIKRFILRYGGVQTSIRIQDLLSRNLGTAYNSDTSAFYYNGEEDPNHDVVIVGWDDTFSVDQFSIEPSRAGAFICRNSYGDEFGEDGYFFVSYDDVHIGKSNIVYSKIESNDNYDTIYQSDWLGWVGRIGFGEDTAYFSNIYTTQGKELLEAVSFYATDADTNYEIYVIDDYTDVNDYKNMTFVKRGSFDYSGYYTVRLDTPIVVNGDYAVIVKVTTPDSLFPVAAEYNKDVEWLPEVDLTDGRGYMSYEGEVWESTEEILESNVCLKAFTSNVVSSDEIVEEIVEETVEEPE